MREEEGGRDWRRGGRRMMEGKVEAGRHGRVERSRTLGRLLEGQGDDGGAWKGGGEE